MNTLLTEAIVLITIGWLATLYAWRQKWLRQQRAWQWWHQQQNMQSHHTAESIRDGLLQQTFAFRRYLETVDETTDKAVGTTDGHTASPSQTQQWLNRFQGFYQSLETLSDELSPPFISDSLPLALQFTLKNWQSTHGQSLPPFQLDLPQNWPPHQSTPQQNQTLLSIVNSLLGVLLPNGHSAEQVNVNLSHQDVLNTLTLKIDYGEQPPPQAQLELDYLKEIFHSLTAGQLEITHETLSITSCFSWQNNKTSE